MARTRKWRGWKSAFASRDELTADKTDKSPASYRLRLILAALSVRVPTVSNGFKPLSGGAR
jgi:hypothetical protein